jgi:P-type Ca2+ transporter type 2C
VAVVLRSSARSRRLNGLTEAEATRRLQSDGPNELNPGIQQARLMAAWDVLRQPMLLLLVVAAIVYLSAGDRIEALPLIASIVVVVGIELLSANSD